MTISAEIAKQKAYCEYDKYRKRIQNELSPVEIHFIESFENEVKHLKKKVARLERARNSYVPTHHHALRSAKFAIWQFLQPRRKRMLKMNEARTLRTSFI